MSGHTPYTRPCALYSTVSLNRNGQCLLCGTKNNRLILTFTAVPWLRRLVADLSRRRSGFDTMSVHVRFVVESGNRGRYFLGWMVWPCQRRSTMSHTQLHLHAALTNNVKRVKHRIFQKTIHRLSLSRVSTSHLSVSFLNPCS